MYLSRIWLDVRKRETMRALSNVNHFHGAVEAADPGHTRKLWRIDRVGGRYCLLVLSADALDLSGVSGQFGDGRYEQACYDDLLDNVRAGTTWRFRLTANPSICKTSPESGKTRYGHVTVDYQAGWLAKRAERNGFSLADGGFGVTGRKDVCFRKKTGENVKFVSCEYEGLLTVSDEDKFRDMLVKGFGREKSYGQGLMTLMPVRFGSV